MKTVEHLETLKQKLPKISEENIQGRMQIYEQLAKGNSKLKKEEGEELFHYLRKKQEREMFHRKKIIELMQDGNPYNKADILARIECGKLLNEEVEHEAQYKYLRGYAAGISDLLSAIMQNNSILKLELK